MAFGLGPFFNFLLSENINNFIFVCYSSFVFCFFELLFVRFTNFDSGFPFTVGSELPTLENGLSFPENLVIVPILKGKGYSLVYLILFSIFCVIFWHFFFLILIFDYCSDTIPQLIWTNIQLSMAGGQV
jgi:hypothetical protein